MAKTIWSYWRKFGVWLGDKVTRAFLVAFYFTIALPFGLVMRFTQDPLGVDKCVVAHWTDRHPPDPTLKSAARLY